MPKIINILNNHKEFEDNIERIIQYANEIIADLPYRRRISIKEKFLLLESLVLRSCALWEKFIETELILAVHFDASRLIEEMDLQRSKRLDIDLIRAILFSDSFKDLHDLNRSKSVLNSYISDRYNPFNQISNKQFKSIQFTYKIRNYLSHYSRFSRKKLFDAYKRDYNMKHFVEPGQFLLKNKGKQFKYLISNFKYSSINMKKIFRRC